MAVSNRCCAKPASRRKANAYGRKTIERRCDEKGNALFIDISGIGGVTYSRLAPEMRREAPDESFRACQLNDTWAYGKVLHEIASHAGCHPFATQMQYISGKLMSEDPYSRMPLSVAVVQLRQLIQRPFDV